MLGYARTKLIQNEGGAIQCAIVLRTEPRLATMFLDGLGDRYGAGTERIEGGERGRERVDVVHDGNQFIVYVGNESRQQRRGNPRRLATVN